MLARVCHAAIAVLVLAALAIQIDIAVQVAAHPPGHAVGTLAGTALGGRLVRVVSFFTIQSNILCGLVSAMLAVRPHRDGRAFRVLHLDALVGITVTGIVYSTVLARVHEPRGWEQHTTNTIFHYVVPIAMVLTWLLCGPRPRMDRFTVGWSLLWPLLWFDYTLLRGDATQWYPYPFVDAATHGYARVLLNALLVTLVLLAVAGVFAFGDRRLPSREGAHDA